MSETPEQTATPSSPATPRFTALVLAASRRGPDDAVAQIQGKSHKCLVRLNGTAMIERVIQAVVDTPEISRVFISIEDPDVLREVPKVAAWLDSGAIVPIKSRGNLAESMVSAVADIPEPYPLIVTAGDNALHTSEMLSHFCTEVGKGSADAYVGMTRAQLILDKYPEGARAFHRLKDDAYSSCNLYATTTPAGVNGAKPFATGGQFGKKPMRIAKGFGVLSLILYKLKLISLDGVMRRISKAIGAKADAVLMPWAEGPIDVDNPKDFALVTKILKGMEGDREQLQDA
jgi:GTP:adenosylcobinamide-phosphate guanylyltransferase